MVQELDRELFKYRHGKSRRRSSRVNVLSTAFAVVLVVGTIAGLMALVADNGVPQTSGPPARIPARVSYSIHSPIDINGNAGFTTENGVSGGDGSISDPYVIADWDINASTSGYPCIRIHDTDAHFIIRNCYVHNSSGSGIQLEHCANGTVEHNTCFDNYYGISVHEPQNVTVVGNNCSSNRAGGIMATGYSSSNSALYDNICNFDEVGIFLNQVSNITVANNTCASNSYEGFYLYSARNNTLNNNTCTKGGEAMEIRLSFGNILANNTFSSTSFGTRVYDSGRNTFINNTFSFNGDAGLSLVDSANNTFVYNTCAMNEGSGIYIVRGGNNTLANNNCSSNTGYGVLVAYYGNNTIVSNVLSLNGLDGAWIAYSADNTLDSNNCSSNGRRGIQIDGSNGNVMLRNQLCYNLDYGIYVAGSSSNLIFNNTLIGNNGAGSTYDPSHVQAYDEGTDNWWNSTEGYGNYWSDWTTPDLVPPYGIVDQPYFIDGGVGAADFYPQTTPQLPIPEFGLYTLVVIALLAMLVLVRERRRGKA